MDMTVFYAAVAAVATGDIAEAEIIHQTDTDATITVTTVLVRREVRPHEVLP